MRPLPDGNGALTEIGSVPQRDPWEALAEAPHARSGGMPFVPELPRRDPREGMLERVVCEPGADLPPVWRASGLHEVLDLVSVRPSLMKVAVAGPLVMMRSGRAFDAGLAARLARALYERGWDAVVQFDEPGTTESPSDSERRSLSAAIDAAREAGAHVVIHDCGAVSGASLLALAPDAVSVDATKPSVPLVGDGPALRRYLASGGSVIWGVVSTDGGPLPDSADVRALLDRAGAAVGDRELVRRRGWLSPACGLGALTIEEAQEIRAVLMDVAQAWR